MSREQFCRAHVTGYLQRSVRKVGCVNLDRRWISICATGDLAKKPVAVRGIGQNNRGPQLRAGQIGERKSDQDDRAGCRWDHAASSSGRLQSRASACSLSKADSSVGGASSSTVINARRGLPVAIGPTGRTRPSASTTASMTCGKVTIVGAYVFGSPKATGAGKTDGLPHSKRAVPKDGSLVRLELVPRDQKRMRAPAAITSMLFRPTPET